MFILFKTQFVDIILVVVIGLILIAFTVYWLFHKHWWLKKFKAIKPTAKLTLPIIARNVSIYFCCYILSDWFTSLVYYSIATTHGQAGLGFSPLDSAATSIVTAAGTNNDQLDYLLGINILNMAIWSAQIIFLALLRRDPRTIQINVWLQLPLIFFNGALVGLWRDKTVDFANLITDPWWHWLWFILGSIFLAIAASMVLLTKNISAIYQGFTSHWANLLKWPFWLCRILSDLFFIGLSIIIMSGSGHDHELFNSNVINWSTFLYALSSGWLFTAALWAGAKVSHLPPLKAGYPTPFALWTTKQIQYNQTFINQWNQAWPDQQLTKTAVLKVLSDSYAVIEHRPYAFLKVKHQAQYLVFDFNQFAFIGVTIKPRSLNLPKGELK